MHYRQIAGNQITLWASSIILKQCWPAEKDNALLRFSLGNEYLKNENLSLAIQHLRAAVEQDAGYSAAWKLLGKALTNAGDADGAKSAYARGISAATQKGDKQAAKEMTLFMKRLDRLE